MPSTNRATDVKEVIPFWELKDKIAACVIRNLSPPFVMHMGTRLYLTADKAPTMTKVEAEVRMDGCLVNMITD